MTAGAAGGQIKVVAYNDAGAVDTTAAGTVTVTLYPKANCYDTYTGLNAASNTYSFEGTMSAGVAYVTVPTTVTEAGCYYIKATLSGFEGDSVDVTDDDTLIVNPKAEIVKLMLTSEKSVISNDATNAAGTTITAYLLDKYGNKTKNATGSSIALQFKDSNSVVSDTALSISIVNNASKGTDVLGNAPGEVLKLGTTSLVASIPTDATIQASDPLAIKVVDRNLIAQVNSAWTAPVSAGVSFKAFDVALDGNTTSNTAADGSYVAPGSAAGADEYVSTSKATTIVVKHVVKGQVVETIEVSLAQASSTIEALFQKATGTLSVASDEYYIIADSLGAYGEVTVANQGNDTTGDITAASPSTGKLVNGHNEEVTALKATPSGTNFVATFNESQLRMTDPYGNNITVANAGTISVTSQNGSVSIAGGNSVLKAGETGDVVTITYDPAKFTGTDTLSFAYTKPGVTANDISVDVPSAKTLTNLAINVEQTAIPVNAEVGVEIESLDQSGKRYVYTPGVTISWSGSVNPTITGLYGGAYASGQLVDFTTNPGREVLTIAVGESTGEFTITLTSADGSVTASKTFTVTREAVAAPPAPPATSPKMDAVEAANLDPAANEVKPADVTNVTIAPCLNVPDDAQGQSADLYAAIAIGSDFYVASQGLFGQVTWDLYQGGDIPSFASATLGAEQCFDLGINGIDLSNFPGSYDIYYGYAVGGDFSTFRGAAYRVTVE
ncbi:hypothetical protein [Dissulfuribacter thermophilus]|nr:hypothetical protein [Dissulfuribacter thermophilus]